MNGETEKGDMSYFTSYAAIIECWAADMILYIGVDVSNQHFNETDEC